MSTSNRVYGGLPLAEIEGLHAEYLDHAYGKPAPPKYRAAQSDCTADHRATMHLEDTFDFGKYKGKRTLQYVIEHDPGYIQWLIDNKVVYLSPEAHTLIQDIEDHPHG